MPYFKRLLILKSVVSYLVITFLLQFQLSANASSTIADYSTLPSIQSMRISPSGKLIAFRSQKNNQDTLNIYSLSPQKVVRVIDLSNINPKDFFFINDEQLIFKGSNRTKIPGFKGIVDLSSAFVLDIQSGSIRQLLIPGKGIYLGQTGLGSIVGVAKNGKSVYMPAYHSKDEFTNNPNYALMKVSLNKIRTPKVTEKGQNSVRDYFLDDDGNPLAREYYNQKTNVHRIDVKDSDSKKWRTIFKQNTPFIDYGFRGLTPDRKSLVFIEEDSKSDHDNLFLMSLKDGTISDSQFGRSDADIEGSITDSNRVLYGVQYSGFKPSYQFFDKNLNKRMSGIVKSFPGDSVLLMDHSPDWKHIIVKVTGSSAPGDFYLYSLDKQKPVFLATARPNIEIKAIHPTTALSYKARDGLNIPLLLTIPRSKVDSIANLPAVLLPHGGPESHDIIDFDWLAQSLANQGYLVIQPQFRGSDGFGLKHLFAGRGEWGQKMQDDLTDSIHYLDKTKIIDPSRVCIVGWSYGGYAALAGAAFSPNLYKCAVSINGVSDVHKMLKTEKRDHGRHSSVLAYWEEVTAKGKTSKEELLKISPAAHTDKIQIPVLLFHANKDQLVNINQSKSMYKMMKKSQKNVSYIKLKNDGHHILEQKNRTLMLNKLITFVNTHIGSK